MNCFHLGGRVLHSRSFPPMQRGFAALHKPPRAARRKPSYFRDHSTPFVCLPLPHSPTPRPPFRRIARPPTLQLSSRFDCAATHARTLLPEELASVPFWYVLVRARVRSKSSSSRPSPANTQAHSKEQEGGGGRGGSDSRRSHSRGRIEEDRAPGC
jgi:hypothetical protein